MTARRWSLGSIFTGLIVILLLVFGGVVAAVTYSNIRTGFEAQLRARGAALASTLSRAVAYKLYSSSGSVPDIDDIVQAIQQDPDVVFVAVADTSGRILVQTTAESYKGSPESLVKLASESAEQWALAPTRDFFVHAADVTWSVRPTVSSSTGLDEFGAPIVQAEPDTSAPARLEKQGTAYVAISKRAVNEAARSTLLALSGATLALLVVASLVAFFVTRWVTQPLVRMVDFASAMARGDYQAVGEVRSRTREVGELADAIATMRESLAMIADQARSIAAGDLSKRVKGAGQLGDAFNAMVESLSRLVGQIKKASLHMASASSEILAASRQAEKGSAEQASSINQTTTTMDELLSASKQIAVSADSVVKIAERTLGAAKSGEDAVKQSITGMQEISSNNRQTAERILELSERNQQIGNIVDLIDEIADKSDLLALNAAIEGAKAGEAGKGFAVVATEMRSLAENVVESTKEIKQLITEIQKASNASVLATEGQMKATERGTSIALNTGERLREILQMVEQTTEAAKQISLATQQQRTGTEQVVQSMAEIAKIAKTNVSGATQTTASTGELAKLADDLKQAVSQFRLGAEQQ